jgi:hypothetical protein
MGMSSANEKGLRLPRSRDRQSYSGRLGSRLLPLAGAAALTFLLLPASASAEGVAGYTIVQSSTVQELPGQSVVQHADCPTDPASGAQTVPTGGGVYSSSSDPTSDTNSSWPIGNSWFGATNTGAQTNV